MKVIGRKGAARARRCRGVRGCGSTVVTVVVRAKDARFVQCPNVGVLVPNELFCIDSLKTAPQLCGHAAPLQ